MDMIDIKVACAFAAIALQIIAAVVGGWLVLRS